MVPPARKRVKRQPSAGDRAHDPAVNRRANRGRCCPERLSVRPPLPISLTAPMSPNPLILALGVLPAAPAELSVSRAEGGDAPVRFVGHCDRGLVVRMATADADVTTGVTFVVDCPSGAAFAVFGAICRITELDDGDCEAVIEVDEVARWKH